MRDSVWGYFSVLMPHLRGVGFSCTLNPREVRRSCGMTQHGVGCGHAMTQLRVGRRKRHNSILGYNFRVMTFKWGV